MREEHPIDERFKALYDAEAAPPGEVRDSLARQLGWDAGATTSSTWRSWSMLLVSAALAVSSASYLLLPAPPQGMNTMVSAVHVADRVPQPVPMDPRGSNSGSDSPDPKGTRVEQALQSHAAVSGTGSIQEHRTISADDKQQAMNGAVASSSENSLLDDGLHHDRSSADFKVSARTAVALRTAGITEQVRRGTYPRDGGSHGDLVSFESPRQPTLSSGTTELPDTDALDMDLLYSTLPGPAAGSPIPAHRPAPYVLENAQWWLGLYAGLGKSSGTWRGQHTDELNTAERWRGSTQWGAQVGRTWRNGWSISAGAGLELTQSTFTHDERVEALFTEVDTTWTATAYNNTQDLVYTWNIDTVTTTRPTETRRSSARNRYGAIEIPLTLAWHGDLRRWRYGLLGGLIAYIPTQREGRTLLQDANDATMRVVNLADELVDRRFGPRMSAHFGLSLGYLLNEHLAVYAEPTLFAPIPTFTSTEAPLMRGYSFQIRLQHEFGHSPR
jgi:hypothetical protein